ncbi:adhesion G-protein coupled receptor D1-like [Dendronephthya gigantea]|uniref:adhesion G-protein coupled receptor D1-like n=1 Tax=Dendronephthya gigantea TaxID=151771 RepID=UPI001069641C|nr:adhesion G-protein coupled receptor D1-like [Dendronephthya gigantea]
MYFKLIICGLCLANSLIEFSKGMRSEAKSYKCEEQRRFRSKPTVKKGSGKPLVKISIMCTASNVAFQIRYSNGSLCTCGSIREEMVREHKKCHEKLSTLDIIINASANSIKNGFRDTCDVLLHFVPSSDGDFEPIYILLTPTQLESSSVNPRSCGHGGSAKLPCKSLATKKSIMEPRPITSSLTNQHLTTSSRRKSEVIPPMKTPSQFINHSPVLPVQYRSKPIRQTPALQAQSNSNILAPTTINPVLHTSSLVVTIGFKNKDTGSYNTAVIKASPTKANILPTTTTVMMTEQQKKFKEDVNFIKNFNTSDVDINDKKTIKRVLDAAANLITSNQTNTDQNQDAGMQAVEVLEDLGNSISQQLDLANESAVTFQEVTKELVFGAAVINVTSSKEYSFPSKQENVVGDEKIVIPNSVFNPNSEGKAYFVGIIYKAYREMRRNTGGLKIGTKVINAALTPPPRHVFNDPVAMMFEKDIAEKSISSSCSFWIEDDSLSGEHGRWSKKQCFRSFENQSHIGCECYHFTNFAVLFKVTNNQDLSEEHTYRLVIISYIGLILSIVGCFLTFVIYVSLKNIKSERAVIHTNLVLALGIADLIFLIGIAAKPVENACLAVSMLVFYFYLAVFFWMLVEGVYIYLMVTKVFRGNVARERKLGYLIGWGFPLVIAITTWAVLRNDIVSKYYCWLSVETGAIWAFVAPGLIIILVNCIILLAVIKTTWTTFSDKTDYSGLKSASKTFGAVIPILGITWVFGVMAFNESSVVFQYIFAITNSLQGALIFVLYCLVNQEVRNEIRRRILRWRARRELTSSSSDRRNILKSTQSGKGTLRYSTQDRSQELKKKQSLKQGLLFEAGIPPGATKESAKNNVDDAKSRKGKGEKKDTGNTILDNSFATIGYV